MQTLKAQISLQAQSGLGFYCLLTEVGSIDNKILMNNKYHVQIAITQTNCAFAVSLWLEDT